MKEKWVLMILLCQERESVGRGYLIDSVRESKEEVKESEKDRGKPVQLKTGMNTGRPEKGHLVKESLTNQSKTLLSQKH